jgi:hypothetical protein
MTMIVTSPAAEARADMDGLWVALIDADAHGDSQRLARIAWELYGRLGQAQAAQARLRAAMRTLARRPTNVTVSSAAVQEDR